MWNDIYTQQQLLQNYFDNKKMESDFHKKIVEMIL